MPEQEREYPIYFDGSNPIVAETADDIAQESATQEEWRRYIGANPFGTVR
ncbi:hypothetical protein [Paenibacillus abyssi]|uniref:Uncharacterized protein n=1 Tax=Paenibacillus abyssi TaxID=1340531 RepID=A0A917LI48_9BACL|nr:hypothetical protein [Paenibacillus abyssi]GGG25833.1 hypothetical protein GCM10010916_47830 [Paenibacillus abyssi]